MPDRITIPTSDATNRQLLTHLIELTEAHMADMTAALNHLATSVANEIAQIRGELAAQVDALTGENQAAKDALAAKVAELDGAVAKVEQMAADFDANDPAPAPESDPAAPVDVPAQPVPAVDPTDTAGA